MLNNWMYEKGRVNGGRVGTKEKERKNTNARELTKVSPRGGTTTESDRQTILRCRRGL